MVKTYKTSKDNKMVYTSLDNFKTRKIRLGKENYQSTTGNVVTIEQEKPTPTFTCGASCAGLMFDIIGHAMCTQLLHTLQNGRCIVLWRAANKTFPFLGAWSTLVWTVTPSSPSSPVTIMISCMGTCSVRRRNTVYSRNANHQYCCTKKNLHIF